MYPYIILWTNNFLNEYFDGNIYGHIKELNKLNLIVYEQIEKIIIEFENEIKHEIKEDNFNWIKFCEMVNNEAYNNSMFFELKYYDVKLEQWNDYELEQIELEHIFIKIIKKIYKIKLKLSDEIMKEINLMNNKKNKKYSNNNNDKSKFVIEI